MSSWNVIEVILLPVAGIDRVTKYFFFQGLGGCCVLAMFRGSSTVPVSRQCHQYSTGC